MRGFVTTVSILATALVAAPALAATASGQYNGISWTAESRIIGQTPTASGPTAGGGDPLYFPNANKSGVVALIMEYSNGDRFICSGSLLNDRRSIATAGHCVSGGAGTDNPMRTTAYFFNGDPNQRTPFQVGGVAIDVTDYFVNEGYTGAVIDHNDIAILRLGEAAPTSALSYGLDNSGDLTGTLFNVAGYGGRSTIGGSFGNNAQTGWLREGDNEYDYRLGDDAFGGQFEDIFADQGPLEFSFVSDFDNGLAVNDTAGRTAFDLGAGTQFNDTGLGAREVNIAGGDSGGPGFVNGNLASINSYGLSFGAAFGDFRPGLNSSWGEFSGYVPIYIHRDWINSVLVDAAIPEPATWAMMIGGFGLVGATMRRRRSMGTVVTA